MKLTHKLFHRMINRSCKLQGCSLIYTGMVKDLDVPVLLLTLGIIKDRSNNIPLTTLDCVLEYGEDLFLLLPFVPEIRIFQNIKEYPTDSLQ